MTRVPDFMMLIDLLISTEKQLARAGIESARLDAEVLLAHALRMKRADLYTNRTTVPSDEDCELFRSLVGRRAGGCPVAYITGVKEFWSIPIKVTRDVLIPRPETELVVERALKLLRLRDARRATRDTLNILDLCTGSGCIAAALAKELPRVRLTVTDISQEAIEVARTNLAFATGRVEFLVGDLFESLGGVRTYDIITANPPYVAVGDRRMLGREIADHEPPLALFAGESGLDFARRIIEDAPSFLKPGGWLVMEIGIGQTDEVRSIARASGAYDENVLSKDLAGIERVTSLRARPLTMDH